MWTVSAVQPKGGWNWAHFKADYFPRTFAYKTDAMRIAQEAIRGGGLNVTVTSAKTFTPVCIHCGKRTDKQFKRSAKYPMCDECIRKTEAELLWAAGGGL